MKACAENEDMCLYIKEGILFFEYKNRISIDLKQAIEIVAARMELQQGIAYPILCDISYVREIDRDARRYLATEGSLLSKALALVSNTPVSKSISSLFLQNNNPSIPIKICKSNTEAIHFLRQFI